MTHTRPRVIIVGARERGDVVAAIDESRELIDAHADVLAVDLDDELDLESTDTDLIVLFGGDGALLSVARRLGATPVPVVGVNFGKFGFLAEFRYDEFLADAPRIFSGQCPVRERSLLWVEHRRDGERLFASLAFNDVVISRGHFSRIIQLSVRLDGKYVTRYHVDGLIVATPTGSTAHSLAAGGPLVHPDLQGLLITPICPHAISIRPLLVPGDRSIEIALRDKSGTVAATIDGQVHVTMELDDTIVAREARHRFLLVESGRRTYFQTLEQKLDWRGHGNLRHGSIPPEPQAEARA